jgi:hypothetical protein
MQSMGWQARESAFMPLISAETRLGRCRFPAAAQCVGTMFSTTLPGGGKHPLHRLPAERKSNPAKP